MSASVPKDEGESLVMVEVDDMVEVYNQRRAVSSGEPSLDGSVDEERAALSDSDLPGAMRIQTLATQAKGPSSDALEVECRAEHVAHKADEVVSSASNDDWKDIIGNGQLLCKVLHEGTGPKPRNGQQVVISVKDTKLGVDSVEDFSFVLGFSMVIDAWEMVVQLMHEGEVDVVKSESRFAYGSMGDSDRGIPPHQSMEYTIKLVKIDDGPTYSNMPREQLITYISQLKERGNYYYARKELDKAVFVYKRCTDLIVIPEDDEPLRHLFSVVFSNLAVCYAKLCDWKSTLDASDEALRLNPLNTKALFRRANAYANLNFNEEAINTLKIASNIDPNDDLIDKELHRLKARQRVCREQERSLYKRMLSGANTEHGVRQHRSLTVTLRYVFLAFFVVVLALFIHFLSVVISK